MKTIIKSHTLFLKRMGIAVLFVALVFSCSKNTDNTTNTTVKFCGTVSWSNTIKLLGFFKGELINGKYGLTSQSITDNGIPTTTTFGRDATGHLVNQSNLKFTYDKDNLVKIVLGDVTGGTGTFSFDTNSHLTSVVVVNVSEGDSTKLTWSYIYDSNDDPVKITVHGTHTSSSGTSISDYDITADYLTDKPGFLSFDPELAPFSPYFAYGFYLSKHLINKWQIKITGKDEIGVALKEIDFTQQYTYTYDANGRVATMVHTGNSKNIFTFTYSDCN